MLAARQRRVGQGGERAPENRTVTVSRKIGGATCPWGHFLCPIDSAFYRFASAVPIPSVSSAGSAGALPTRRAYEP